MKLLFETLQVAAINAKDLLTVGLAIGVLILWVAIEDRKSKQPTK
jgi:hypothetical protein